MVDRPFRLRDTATFYMSYSHRRFVADFTDYVSSPTQFARIEAERQSGLTSLLNWVAGLQGVESTSLRVLLSHEGQCGDGRTINDLCQSLDLPKDLSSEAGLKLLCEQIDSDADRGLSVIWLLDRPNQSLIRFASELSRTTRGLRLLFAGPAMPADDGRGDLGCDLPLDQRIDKVFSTTVSRRIQFNGLQLAETVDMLEMCLSEVGGDKVIFSETAVRLLYRLSKGRVGFLTEMAEDSLRLAAQWSCSQVTADHVGLVFQNQLQDAA